MKRKRGQNEGSYYRKSDGRWAFAISIDGKRYPEICQRSKETVKAFRKRAEKAIEGYRNQIALTHSPDSLGNFLLAWLEHIKTAVSRKTKEPISPKTWESYRYTVHTYILPSIGPIRLQEAKEIDVEAAMRFAAEKKAAPRTQRYVRSILRIAFAFAYRHRLVSRNPAADVDAPATARRQVTLPDAAEWDRFLLAIDGHPYEPLLLIYALVGGRKGEGLAPRWSDYDDTERILRLERAIQRIPAPAGAPTKSILTITTLKTEKSRRVVAVGKLLAEALRRYRVRQLEWQMANRERWDRVPDQFRGLIFTTKLGTPLEPRRVNQMVTDLLAGAKLPHRTVHELRHIAASNMLARGVPLDVVQEVLGHASIMTTKDIYGHVPIGRKREAAAAMDAIGARKK